jgi:hypothetical protein
MSSVLRIVNGTSTEDRDEDNSYHDKNYLNHLEVLLLYAGESLSELNT